MSYSYSLNLVVGFEISAEEFDAVFLHSHTEREEGIFHMEDRFDSKTGVKTAPVKVWDKKPKNNTTRWYEVGGEKHDFYIDPEELTDILGEHFSCHVERFGNWSSGDFWFAFYVNKPKSYQDSVDTGRYTIYNQSISIDELNELQPKIKELHDKLKEAGLPVKEPKVFITQICC